MDFSESKFGRWLQTLRSRADDYVYARNRKILIVYI